MSAGVEKRMTTSLGGKVDSNYFLLIRSFHYSHLLLSNCYLEAGLLKLGI